jgi:hypothetical protein
MFGPKIELCYLCGNPMSGEEENNVDHIPMKQLWTPEIRKSNNPNLVTRKVHKNCNSEYQLDEDYFVATILPLSKGSFAGESHYKKLTSDIVQNKNLGLKLQVLDEFSNKVGSILLPNSKVAKSFETERFNRIVWKILRGLFFLHNDVVLPLNWPIIRDIFLEDPPEHFRLFSSLPEVPEYGDYPGVFSYRYTQLVKPNGLHYWAMLFFDKVIITACFHDTQCDCEVCVRNEAGAHANKSRIRDWVDSVTVLDCTP